MYYVHVDANIKYEYCSTYESLRILDTRDFFDRGLRPDVRREGGVGLDIGPEATCRGRGGLSLPLLRK
jgi:hypothetical protein